MEFDLDGGVFDAIGSVHGVLADINGEVLPDRTDRGLFRIGCTNQLAQSGDRVFAFSSAMATIGEEDMNSTSSSRNGRPSWTL